MSFKGHFHYDQAYVALSRSRKMNGIQLIDFDPKKMRASPAVTRETNRLLPIILLKIKSIKCFHLHI